MRVKKEYLKDLARHIRTLKFNRKGGKSQEELWDINYELAKSRRRFRHEHIAYCLVRGRSYEQIERPAENNKPDLKLIDSLFDTLQKQVDVANEEWAALKKEVSNE